MELLIAVVLLGTVIVVVCSVFIQGMNVIKKGKVFAEAANIANKKIDEINSIILDEPDGISTNNLIENIEGIDLSSVIPDKYISWDMTGSQEIKGIEKNCLQEYKFTIKIEPFHEDMKKIFVEVTYITPDPHGRKKVEITTLLARKITIY